MPVIVGELKIMVPIVAASRHRRDQPRTKPSNLRYFEIPRRARAEPSDLIWLLVVRNRTTVDIFGRFADASILVSR